MTKRKEITRNFRESDSELTQTAEKFIKASERDFDALKSFGFTQQEMDSNKKLCSYFMQLPTDEEILADNTSATAKKEQARKGLKEAMKAVLNRIALHFGKTSTEMKKAGGENLSKLSDAELCQKARRIERTGREHAEALKAAGLSAEILDKLNTTTNSFDDLIDEQKDLAVQRDIKTRERVNKANELYKMVVRLSDLGKAAFETSNPALYESYKLNIQSRKKTNSTEETTDEGDEGANEETTKG